MERNEIPFLSATELADLYRSGEVSPVEATEAYLSRIEQVDPGPELLHYCHRRSGEGGGPAG